MARFLFGLCLILAFAALMAWGPLPPGWMGTVVQHNQESGADATALFYTEVDGYASGTPQ